MTTDIDVNIEPLPGYRLLEHLGAGGYGEVWRAEAPGGLTKAIKFIFGQHHEKRASNELRALDHVRSVRHPFLLSLERIEVVGGRLLIVTELADGSLKDCFDACRRDGLGGIPRHELLGYLRDAADALDFMSDAHALQHLDIKPENLLVLAGHVKVADFGLVKDVRQSQASLVGGMTPLYSAPEVFRGAPSRHSDQYSLAIVYQEMLTGALPFAGGNAAELTLQHLNDEPDLSALSAADRYAVSRALSKDPQHRYATCREFVEALLRITGEYASFEVGSPLAEFVPPAESCESTTRPSTPTDVFDECESADWSTPQQIHVDYPAADCQIVDLPPLDLTTRDWRPAPTLVLGIGGTAARVLSHLRRIIHDELDYEARLPAVQFVLLDTDSRTLSETIRSDGSGLSPDETLNLPLRRPQHYREHSQKLLNWLSRRWLYNIPRSLRTEGLRPLGRLALADHARQAGQRIRRAVTQALDAESVAVSSQSIGHTFCTDALRVYVVASIAGGTGSGMALDIGYAVRAILEKLGIPQTQIIGLMMHSTGGDPRHCELARVNAFSWLAEFHHFQQPENAYPGDASCGLPPHPAGAVAFDHTYLTHLGENLNSTEFDQAIESVAEYLRLNVLTPAGAAFDACRDAATDPPEIMARDKTGGLRSFGMFQRTAAPSEVCEEFAGRVSRQVLANWGPQARPVSPDDSLDSSNAVHDETATSINRSQAVPGAAQLVNRLQLESGGVATNARALVETKFPDGSAAFLSSWFAKQLGAGDPGERGQLQAIDCIFGSTESDGAEGHKISLLGESAGAIVEPLAEKLRSEIRRWVTSRIDDTRERLIGARRCINWLHDHCRQIECELQRLRSTVVGKALALRRETTAAAGPLPLQKKPGGHQFASQLALAYFGLRLDQVATVAAQHLIHLLLCDAKAMSDEITALGHEIDQLALAVSRAAGTRPATPDATTQAQVAANLQAKLPAIAAEVDARLQLEFINAHGGLLKLIMQGGRPRAQLTAKLQEVSRQSVHHALAGINVLDDALGANNAQSRSELRSGLAAAAPALLEFGGARRVLAIVPRDAAGDADQKELSQALGAPVTTVAATDNNLTFCVEANQLSLAHVALQFVERRRDRVEFAGRVHCRTDIEWMPLVETAATSSVAEWGGAAPLNIESRAAMCKTLVM